MRRSREPQLHRWRPHHMAAAPRETPPDAPLALLEPGALPPPGDAPPSSSGVLDLIPLLYPFGPGKTEFKYLYDQLINLDNQLVIVEDSVSAGAGGALPLSGGTLTGTLTINTAAPKLILQKSAADIVTFDANGALDINLPGDLGVIAQFRHSGVTDLFVSSSGNAHIRGNLGVGTFADTPPYRLWVREVDVETFFTAIPDPGGSGGIGWFLNKQVAALAEPLTVIYQIEGTSKWGHGVDYLNRDYIPVYSHESGYNDAGVRVPPLDKGSDCLRFTPAPDSSTGKSTSWMWSGQAAGSNNTSTWGIMEAGINQSGVRFSIHGGSAPTSRDNIYLEQRDAAHKRLSINYGGRWLLAQDLNAGNTPDFVLFDAGSSAAVKGRVKLVGDNAATPKIGIGTPNVPLCALHTHLQVGAGGVTTIEAAYAAGYSQDLTNRMMGIYQTSDGAVVRNFVLLSGQLAGTAGAPTLTSTGAISAGLERTDTELSLALAPGGAGQTIVRPIRAMATNRLGFFDTAPIARPTVAAAASDPATTQTLANSLRSQLIALGLLQ